MTHQTHVHQWKRVQGQNGAPQFWGWRCECGKTIPSYEEGDEELEHRIRMLNPVLVTRDFS